MEHLKRQVFRTRPLTDDEKKEKELGRQLISRTPFSIFSDELKPNNVVGRWLVPVSGELVDIQMFADIEEKAELSISAVGVGKDVTVVAKLKNGKNSLGSQIPVDQGDLITITLTKLTGKGQNVPVFNSLGVLFTLEFV